MAIFQNNHAEFQAFTDSVESIITNITGHTNESDINGLNSIITNFKHKTEDFFREDRKLNIGVVGQVKAGKSSFLNTLLFGGKDVLPKASTPKTATLTKMEYSEENIIEIEYYTPDDWEELTENAAIDLEDEVYTSSREILGMVRRNGIDPMPYLEKGHENVQFNTYDDLIASLNDYVGEDGKFTPIVKSVTLHLHHEAFQGISIVDTPGLNDPIISRTVRTKEFLEVCDVVFFLSQSGSFLDKSDWLLLSSQLPQKGVKKLVLIASKFDSGLRDVLRVKDEDDIFGDDDNTADNIPQACKIIRKKLTKRAKSKVAEFIRELEQRNSTPELIAVIRQCAEPIMVSAIAYNMSEKEPSEYTPEEQNIYAALRRFSSDMQTDLRLLGNFGQVNTLFDEVIAKKEQILESKSKSFVPTAREELIGLLRGYLEKTKKRIQMLEDNDREQLAEQKKLIGEQINRIKADIVSVFGELIAKLESEKSEAVIELRESSKDYLSIRERTGTITRHGSYTTGHLWWKKTEHYSYEEHYNYCLAADAIENIRKYSFEAQNHVEKVFSETLQFKELKRKLLNVVINNFDVGSADYDASIFKIMVEDTVNSIDFPEFKLDISDKTDSIASKFTGEIKSASEKNGLSTALSKAITEVNESLSSDLRAKVTSFKSDMNATARMIEDKLLDNINKEFEALISQCENKEKEIAAYQQYATILQTELTKCN